MTNKTVVLSKKGATLLRYAKSKMLRRFEKVTDSFAVEKSLECYIKDGIK